MSAIETELKLRGWIQDANGAWNHPSRVTIVVSPAHSIEPIYAAYLRTGSVHKAGSELGLSGETVRQRLRAANKKLNRSKWKTEELVVLHLAYSNAATLDLAGISKQLSRTYAAIACKADELGLCGRRGKQVRTENARANGSAAQKNRAQLPGEYERRSLQTKTNHKKYGHPRGMLGKTHSQATRERLSKAHTGRQRPDAATNQMLRTKLERYGTLAPNRPHGSWKAGWREIGGKRIYARSSWEANYARHLQFLKEHGHIVEWEHEPETFWFEGIKRGVCSYLPDFRVTFKTKVEYHEVKGWMDRKSQTKLTRMAKYHPTVRVEVIGPDWFKKNRNMLSRILPGWETKPKSTRAS